MHLRIVLGLELGIGLAFVESRVRLRVTVEIDDLVSALESSTFRDILMVRIQCI